MTSFTPSGSPDRFRAQRASSTVAALCAMVSLSLSAALSFLIVPGAVHFGVSTDEYLLWFSVQILTAALAFFAVGRIVRRIGVRPVFAAGGFLAAVSLVAAAFSPNVTVFVVTAVPFGVGVAAATLLPGNVLIAQWHDHDRRGTVLGIVSLGTTAGGITWGFLMPPIIETAGFRVGMLTVAGLFVLFAGLPGLFLARDRLASDLSDVIADSGSSRAAGRARGPLVLFAAGVALLSVTVAYDNIAPAVLGGLGVDPVSAGHMVSFSALCGLVWMPLVGYLHDRLTPRRFGVVLAAPFVLGLPVLALLVPLGEGAFWIVIPVIALAVSIPFVAVPLLAAQGVPPRTFPSVYGVILTAQFVGLAISAPAWELLYNTDGSYTAQMISAGVAGVLGVGLVIAAVMRAQRRRVVESADPALIAE